MAERDNTRPTNVDEVLKRRETDRELCSNVLEIERAIRVQDNAVALLWALMAPEKDIEAAALGPLRDSLAQNSAFLSDIWEDIRKGLGMPVD